MNYFANNPHSEQSVKEWLKIVVCLGPGQKAFPSKVWHLSWALKYWHFTLVILLPGLNQHPRHRWYYQKHDFLNIVKIYAQFCHIWSIEDGYTHIPPYTFSPQHSMPITVCVVTWAEVKSTWSSITIRSSSWLICLFLTFESSRDLTGSINWSREVSFLRTFSIQPLDSFLSHNALKTFNKWWRIMIFTAVCERAQESLKINQV